MTESQTKLLKILNELFQLDQSDLDFGIYRIMNSKSDEIKKYLNNDLISKIENAFRINTNSSLQIELDEAVSQANSLGVDPNTIPKVKELMDQISSSSTSVALEDEVYSHLSTFFKRYYKDGDFISLRRYKKDTYAIPYEGEEVKLHWANSDQYYIKSGEYFRDYSFKVEDKTIHFKLSDAETEQNNNKASDDKERRFVLLENNATEIIDDELYINFEYKAVGKKFKQDKLNTDAVSKVLESLTDDNFLKLLNTPAPTEKNKTRTLFQKHLKSYTSRNSFDYFIHKDLGGFLNRELDFYIKNEVLYIDDILESPVKYEEVQLKIKTFKTVAKNIIDFLTQLEELQKKLWEKKKFVIETNYCITLDKIDEEFYQEILGNKEQLEEWKQLFNVEIKTIEQLKEEKFLIIDTKFFTNEFKYKLLSTFDNLDEEIDGVLINSENFGALNLLQERYREQVKCVYIDPPYNAQSSEILYLNTYKHSSWITLIQNRLNISKNIIKKDFVYVIAIDEVENTNLSFLINSEFSRCEDSCVSIVHNPTGQQGKNFSYTHEFAHFIYPENTDSIGMEDRDDSSRESKPDIRPLRNVSSGKNHLRASAKNCFYPIYVKDGVINGFGEVCDDNFHPGKINITRDDGIIEVYPIDPSNIESKWCFAKDTVENILDEIKAEYNKKKNQWDIIRTKSKFRYKSLWSDKRYSANSWGSVVLNNILPSNPFTYPKSLFTVTDSIDAALRNASTGQILDYFAGSGTTGHATINLNREDGGNRKYILVEMGEYFNTVTKPRIQKVIYTNNWKDGKPVDKEGISQIFKYFKLESYEDTLNNIEMKKTEEQQKSLSGLLDTVKEDYLLNYSLDVESRDSLLNIDNFKTPFDYKLKIATSSVGETKDTNIDLVETFNYLLGLVVKRVEMLKGFLIVEGENLKKEKILIIWRNGQSNPELDEFFNKMDWTVYDREFDTIYVNGDNNLANLKKDEDHFKIKLIEQEFKQLMFGEI